MIATHRLFLFSYSNKFNGIAFSNFEAKIRKNGSCLQLRKNDLRTWYFQLETSEILRLSHGELVEP